MPRCALEISWTQVETGSAITWKYPSCILRGDHSPGEFYSIAISNDRQQVGSGTKMIHLGNNTSSRIISKGIAAGRSNNTYRGLVTAHRKTKRARNFPPAGRPGLTAAIAGGAPELVRPLGEERRESPLAG